VKLRLPRFFRKTLPVTLILLTVLVFLPQIQLAHASTFLGYSSGAVGTGSCPANCDSIATQKGKGQAVKAPFTGSLLTVGFQTGTILPDQLIILTFNNPGDPTSTSYGCPDSGTCYFANTGQAFTVQSTSTLTGLTTSAYNTVNLATPVSVTLNKWVAIILMYTPGTATTQVLQFCGSSATPTHCGIPSGEPVTMINVGFSFGTNAPTGSFTTDSGQEGDYVVGGSFQVTVAGSTTITQCYGSCGTLQNTNSTHTVAWNQSITLFLEIQSQLNGVVNNVSITLGKALPSGGFALGLYTISQSCSSNAPVFSPTCPGTLVTAFPFNAPGKQTFTLKTNLQVINGQILGIAYTAFQSPADFNDTNSYSNVIPSCGTGPCQTFSVPGFIPAQITNPVPFSTTDKASIQASITGVTVITAIVPSPSGFNCAGLDCLLGALVSGFCGVASQQCLASSGLFWVVVLTILTTVLLAMGLTSVMPGVRMPMGEFFIFFGLMYVLLFSGLSLLPVWVPILIFSITSLSMGRNIGDYLK